MQYPESPEWIELIKAFEQCLDADLGHVSPLEPYLDRLKAASVANTTHWGDQWQQHNAIRNYLKSWNATL